MSTHTFFFSFYSIIRMVFLKCKIDSVSPCLELLNIRYAQYILVGMDIFFSVKYAPLKWQNKYVFNHMLTYQAISGGDEGPS